MLNFEQNIIKTIEEGDLISFQKLSLSKEDINKYLTLIKEVKINLPTNSTPFPIIRNPTPLILTILFEKSDFLLYIINNKSPDLSIKVNGWSPIHYASSTQDYKCLEILLKQKFILENIDIPVDIPIKCPINQFTTALHIATTNHRYAQVLLLTYSHFNHFKFHSSSNIHQLSSFGNMPIHIAVHQNDWEMCQILLNISNDLFVRNLQGNTPLDIARSYKFENLIEKFREMDLDLIEDLILKYLQNINNNINNNEIIQNNLIFDNINQQLNVFEMRLEKIENKLKKKINIKQKLEICQICGSSNILKCDNCNGKFCNICFFKLNHLCLQ